MGLSSIRHSQGVAELAELEHVSVYNANLLSTMNSKAATMA
jgi:hypothetical protein